MTKDIIGETNISAAVVKKWIAETSLRFKARMAGVSFLVTMLTAAFTEIFVRIGGRLNFAADLAAAFVEVSGMVAVTILLYAVFKPLNKNLSLLAASLNLLALTLEAFQVLNIGLVFHGFYCLLIAYLIFRSTFLPRILGAPMAIAGLCWLTFLPTALANYLSPYNMASALLAEGFLMVWLLMMGVKVSEVGRESKRVDQPSVAT
jgi:Domain of unknown function (DUF4386)